MNKQIKEVEKKVTILNSTGLHARPAAVFVQIANKFESGILKPQTVCLIFLIGAYLEFVFLRFVISNL